MSPPLIWKTLTEPGQRAALAERLLAHARPRRWFRAKSRQPRDVQVADLVWLDPTNLLAIVQIAFASGEDELYAMPLTRWSRQAARQVTPSVGGDGPAGLVALLGAEEGEAGQSAIIDGLVAPGQGADALLAVLRQGRRVRGVLGGELRGETDPDPAGWQNAPLPAARLSDVDQTNSTAIFGHDLLLKIYRQLTAGPNPELEMGRFLIGRGDSSCTPRLRGALWFRAPDGQELSLGVAHQYLDNAGDAFTFMTGALRDHFDRVAGQTAPSQADGGAPGSAAFLAQALTGGTDGVNEAVSGGMNGSAAGGLAARAVTLGRRTAALHLALAGADPTDDAFAPEPLSDADRARLAARTEQMWRQQSGALASARGQLAPVSQALVDALLAPAAERSIADTLARFRDRPVDVVKTRTHGDLHLGQVLVRGDDFAIIDFEGEPARPLAERRAKTSPLRDVMGMVRSFDYAPEVVLREPSHLEDQPQRWARLQPWAALWKRDMTVAYLRGYLSAVRGAAFVPRGPDDLAALLTFFELEKVIYEIGYEVNNRPSWVDIPLRGLAAIAGVRVPGADSPGGP